MVSPREVRRSQEADEARGTQARTARVLRTRQKLQETFGSTGVSDTVRKNKKRIRAAAVSWTIVAFIIPFWLFQLVLWVMSMVGLVTEGTTLVGWVLPGYTIFFAFTIMGIVLGMFFMVGALVMYLFNGVDCIGGFKLIIFGVCLAFSMAPGIFFVPYVFIWCFFVTMLQTGKEKG